MRKIMIEISEYCNNIVRNLFTSLLLAMMAVLVLISTSLILHEWEQYKPFEIFEGKKGIIYCKASNEVDFPDNPICYETYKASCMVDGNYPDCLVYPDWITTEWSPRLQKGKWIGDNEKPEVVVGGSRVPYKVGQKITLELISLTSLEYESFEFEVVGILAEGTKMFNGINLFDSEIKGYDMFYNNPNSELFFVINSNVMTNLNLDYAPASMKIMIYPDEIEEDRFEEIYKTVLTESGGTVTRLDTFLTDSKKIVQLQVVTYVPIVFFGLLLIIVGVVIASYINMKMSMPHSVVFYLVGATPKDRFGLYFFETIINIFISLLLVTLFGITISEIGIQGLIIIEYSKISFLMLGIYYAFIVMVSLFYYMIVWKKISPKEALIKQRAM